MKTREKRRLAGMCVDCGGEIGEDGTTLRCRRDADEWNRKQAARLAARRRRWRKRGLCIQCGGRKQNRRRKHCRLCLLLQSVQDEKRRRLQPSA
jgi:hypothetical protein